MSTELLLKRSSTASAVPTAGALNYGELAINTADGKIFLKKSDNSIVEFINSASFSKTLDDVLSNGSTSTSAISVGDLTASGDMTIGTNGTDSHSITGHLDLINSTTQSLINGSNWSSPSSLTFKIDSDNNSSNANFRVQKDTSTTIFNLSESGLITNYGNMIPDTNNSYTLGSTSSCFSNIFSDKAAYKIRGSDPTTITDHAMIYSKDVTSSAELFVQDEAGNITQISPHNDAGDWTYWSENRKTGKKVKINMEKMILKLEEITGESFFEEYDLGK